MYLIVLLLCTIPLYSNINKEFLNSTEFPTNVINKLDTTYQNEVGESLLGLSAYYGEEDLVNELIKKGANLDILEENGNTPLMNAAFQGNFEIVKKLVQSGADINKKNNYEQDALILAIYQGHKEIAEYLIEQKANINSQDKEGRAPLHYAINYHKKPDLLELLLTNQADINIIDHSQKTVLIEALNDKNILAIELILKYHPQQITNINQKNLISYLVYNAAVSDDSEKLKQLLEIGGKSDSQNMYGVTALQGAASIGSTNIMQILLDYKADINYVTECGDTALTMAVYSEEVQAAEYLISKGADINHREKNGDTAMHIAVRRNNIEMVEMLLKQDNLKMNVKNFENETPLDIAKDNNNEDMIKLLEEG